MISCQAHLFIFYIVFYHQIVAGTTENHVEETANEPSGSPASILELPSSVLTFVDGNATINCHFRTPVPSVWWNLQDSTNITNDNEKYLVENVPNEDLENTLSSSTLKILNVDFNDGGNYSCNTFGESATSFVNVTLPGTVVSKRDTVRLKIDGHDTLFCVFKGYPLINYHWIKDNDSNTVEELKRLTNITNLNETHTNLTLSVIGINRKDNGSYSCVAQDSVGLVRSQVVLLVLDKPQVRIDFVKEVGAQMIYMNWTTNDENDPISKFTVQFMKKGTDAWQFYMEEIGGGNTSYVFKNLDKNSEYKFRIAASNNQGQGRADETPHFIKTLELDPNFIPQIELKGVTFNSMTVGWTVPPPELQDHIHYYELIAQAYNSTTNNEAIHPASSMNCYLFVNLKAATTYHFKVRACSDYTKQCGEYSPVVNGTTLNGMAGPPENVSIQCRFDNISQTSFVFVSWEPPKSPNGKIVDYQVVLTGESLFRNERGLRARNTFGPKAKSVDEKSTSARFDMIPANTNYTVHVSGTTKPKRHGKTASVNCTMPPTTPDKMSLFKFQWNKLEEHGKFVFKLNIPRISERTGAICCYRVFMMKLKPQQTQSDLPNPEDIIIQSYNYVHSNDNGGAYVAEMFASDARLSAVFLGDGYTLNTSNSACLQCIGIRAGAEHPRNQPTTEIPKPLDTVPNSTPINIPTSESPVSITTIQPISTTNYIEKELISALKSDLLVRGEQNRIRRDINVDIVKLSDANADKADPLFAYDGPLNVDSNYTSFVEIIVYGAEKGSVIAAYTPYMDIQRPTFDPVHVPTSNSGFDSNSLNNHLLWLFVVVIVLCIPMVCYYFVVYVKRGGRAPGGEMITLRNSFRQLCRSLRGRHQLVSSHPPNMSPIAKADLLEAYVERHRDSDYGFQQEFEQLPDRFPDRTTRASDARENIYKNRYPDIKAYDQTRVRLSQVDSIAGSDYINANFVLGYKERKKFICTQGPTDNTVCDYWRMIWEQRLELIMMLTNLEEYSKPKCWKYWPDKSEMWKSFGDVTVTHANESRYSDYIIRELKITRGAEERSVTQYHFLVWKDFTAPEHPHGILKFIKRMNEAHSIERGPILVHCSAGVGRTGTLVALDSLLQQLQEERQVTIFNTICDLRHQRNFLVQSLKQYIFVYRALMEMAQYGDTEIPANKIKATVNELKKCEKDKSGMNEEYEKLKSVIEDRKAFSVGTGEENRAKNRNELVIPYDRNRVILTPIPDQEHSIYINASFIEGYDNCESFIISQDPLDNTIADFWRMIFEQGVNIIVMLSDLGTESVKKCPRYWPDDEITYNHIRIKYIQSESCPYYTKRELSVTNKKVDEVVMVTQLQYHGWPTVEGEVPEVTRGLIELADQVQMLQSQANVNSMLNQPPIVVHCHCGSDRSSMFVGLCILIQQLRVERRVDVFATTRKLRSQRSCMINTFSQYEFLYRAIVNYADLHHLCEDSSET